MKKILGLIWVLILGITLTSCKTSSIESTSTSTSNDSFGGTGGHNHQPSE